jgi:putative oxidoreductase
MRTLSVLGRAIFGGYFIYNGINHFKNRKAMAEYAAAKGTPAAEAAVLGSGALLLAGGASVITGLKPREGLGALIAFLVPVSLQMHRFWEANDPTERQGETVNFTKNMALAGAALALMDMPTPWRASIGRRAQRGHGGEHKTYPQLTPGTLRALAH